MGIKKLPQLVWIFLALKLLGFSASRWITSHGFSLNVSNDLSWFNLFPSCGLSLSDKGVSWDVTSFSHQLKSISKPVPNVEKVATETVISFQNNFLQPKSILDVRKSNLTK